MRWPTGWPTEVVGDGLADGVTMGPVHTAGARDRVEALVAEAAAAGAGALRPGRLRGGGRGQRAGTSCRPRWWWRRRPDAGIVREEQFAPALPVIPYDDIARGG